MFLASHGVEGGEGWSEFGPQTDHEHIVKNSDQGLIKACLANFGYLNLNSVMYVIPLQCAIIWSHP